MPIGIDPKVDFAFKRVFGSPDHTAITIHFLNAVLELPQPIASVEILNPIQGKDYAEEKLAILDILALDNEGRRFNVEMQTTVPRDLTKRLTYYNCLNYTRQVKSGEDHHDLRPAINICVLDGVLFPGAEEYHLSFQLRSDQQPELLFNSDLAFHLLELPKFQLADDNRGALGPLEKWIFFLKFASGFEVADLTQFLTDDPFREATEVLEMISETPEEREFYESRRRIFDSFEYQLGAARREAELIGKIKLLHELLGDPVSESSELYKLDQTELSNLLSELQERLRMRGDSDG